MNSKKYSKEFILSVFKPFQKAEKEPLPNSFYEASITLIAKPGRIIMRKENTDQFPDEKSLVKY